VLLAASVLLSRLFGYAREALLAYRVGAGPASDAYYAAFQIPDLLNYLLAGGALSIAFVPLYTRYLARGDRDGAHRLFTTVLGTLTALAAVATAVLWWYAEPLVALQFPRFDAATQALTARLTRIVLPAQVFFIAGGIINATLLARGRFGAAAMAPLLYNGGIIAGGLFLTPLLPRGIEGFSWGALAGAVAGPFLAPLLDTRGRVRLGARFAPTDRLFLAYLLVAAPLMFGQTLLTVDEWYERWFGALLEPGTVAHLSYARKLMLVPVAVVGQAIAAAALPALSRLWAEKKIDELDRLVLRTLQTGLALAAFAGGAFFLLSRDVVALVYEHGKFTAADGTQVAAMLSLLSLAVPAWIAQQIATRAFYARADTWRPMLLGTAVALAAIPLYLALGNRLGAIGLAAAPAIAMSVNALATLLLARWLHGGPHMTPLASTTARAVVVAALAVLVARLLVDPTAAKATAHVANLLRATPVFIALTVAGTWLFGDAAMRLALAQVGRRLSVRERLRRRGGSGKSDTGRSSTSRRD
jgi:putative peptidoglycan lipid II flippase